MLVEVCVMRSAVEVCVCGVLVEQCGAMCDIHAYIRISMYNYSTCMIVWSRHAHWSVCEL